MLGSRVGGTLARRRGLQVDSSRIVAKGETGELTSLVASPTESARFGALVDDLAHEWAKTRTMIERELERRAAERSSSRRRPRSG